MRRSDLNNIYPPSSQSATYNRSIFNGQPKLKQYTPWYATKRGIWPVQAKPNGWMPKLMKALGERFCDALEQHSQILVVRFDLHVPQYTLDNAQISEFISKLNYWIKGYYKAINEVRYVWVREHEKAKQQHYHVVLLLNGLKGRLFKKPAHRTPDTDRNAKIFVEMSYLLFDEVNQEKKGTTAKRCKTS